MISEKIKAIQFMLEQDVYDKLRYYALIKWQTNNNCAIGSIPYTPGFKPSATLHIYAKKNNIIETSLTLSKNYSNYYKSQYTIERIFVKEIINKNPHIKVKLSNNHIAIANNTIKSALNL